MSFSADHRGNQAKSLRLVAGRGSIANALTPRDSCHLETLTLETLAPPRQCREAGLTAIEAALGRSRRRTAPQQAKATGKPPLLCVKSVTGERGAQVVKRPADKRTASFGMTVSIRRVDGRELRIPTKPATRSNRKPATDSDLKPAGVPI
jgi:hypothetical protein